MDGSPQSSFLTGYAAEEDPPKRFPAWILPADSDGRILDLFVGSDPLVFQITRKSNNAPTADIATTTTASIGLA